MYRILASSLPALLVFIAVIPASVASESQSYRGYKLLRIYTNNIDWITCLEEKTLALNKKPSRTQVDVWAEPNRFRNYADVMVSPEILPVFLSMLETRGIQDVKVLKHDLQRNIDKQNAEMEQAKLTRFRRQSQSMDPLENFDLSTYHRYDQIVDHLRNLSWQYPELAEIQNVTKTFEGRDLIGIKMGRAGTMKPAIFIDAGVHAREWIAPAVAVYVANKLITQYGRDDDVTRMVDKFDWYIVPVANPDGYEYSMTVDRYWRKTRSKDEKISKWCYGVDANRNWGYRWGEVGVSKNPCSGIYAGPKAFSEVEIAGIRDFITEEILNLQAYISLHSYGQVILSPWGFTTEKPENYKDQHTAAQIAVEAILNKTGARYKYGSIAELMYPASGTSIDYMLSKKIPYTYGIELRPDDNETDIGFDIPASSIEPAGEEMLSAFLTMAKYISTTKKL